MYHVSLIYCTETEYSTAASEYHQLQYAWIQRGYKETANRIIIITIITISQLRVVTRPQLYSMSLYHSDHYIWALVSLTQYNMVLSSEKMQVSHIPTMDQINIAICLSADGAHCKGTDPAENRVLIAVLLKPNVIATDKPQCKVHTEWNVAPCVHNWSKYQTLWFCYKHVPHSTDKCNL